MNSSDLQTPASELSVEVPTLGAPVEIWSSFTERWAPGFEVAGIERRGVGPAYIVRRRSDGAVLPQRFDGSEVRSIR